MRGLRSFVAAVLVMAAAGTWVACGPSQEEQVSQELAQLAASVQQQKQALDAKRQELQALKDEAAAAAGAAAEGEAGEGESTAVDLPARIEPAQAEVDTAAETLMAAVVDYLNRSAMQQGVDPTPEQLSVIRIKSAEDMVIAQEYIDKGGDYRRAIEIYDTALGLDPQNEALQAAKAHAEAFRFMTAERFEQVTKGMTQDEVRELLGIVNLRNVHDYPERNVIAWFYPKQEGGAAGVYFQEKGGKLLVYQTNFEAVKPQGGE